MSWFSPLALKNQFEAAGSLRSKAKAIGVTDEDIAKPS
jgi:hypothetical protein